jgi:nucleoside-diphosphate-sugar epimerase
MGKAVQRALLRRLSPELRAANVYARYHNIFGPDGSWQAVAICRKVAMARSGEAIEVWGDGEQTRALVPLHQRVRRSHGAVIALYTGFAISATASTRCPSMAHSRP